MIKELLNKQSEIVFDNAQGAYLFSKGVRYIDICIGCGTHVLGHSNIHIPNGTLYGASHSKLERFISLLKESTGLDRFIFCASGSEATMRAARLARAYTGKNKIIMFNGGWHGTSNTFLDCEGIPQVEKDLVLRLSYGDISQLVHDDVAMVIIEPVQGSLPQENKEFLVQLREYTKKHGILLVFDEVVTGFRLALGGAREYFGVECDLVTYGKAIGGGLPIGIVAGKAEILDGLMGRVFLGGTWSANPATVATGLGTLETLVDTDPYSKLNLFGKVLRDSIKINGCQMVGTGSFNRLLFTDKPVKSRAERDANEDEDRKQKFYKKLLEHNVFMGTNGLMFISTKHTIGDIYQVIDAFNFIGIKV